jgi:hypothetical protein
VGNVQGSLIPVSQQRHNYLTDSDGTLIVTKLNTTLLKSVAHKTGGQFAAVRPRLSGADTLWQNIMLSPEASRKPEATPFKQRSGIATGLLLCGIFLFSGALMTTQD